jgi:hypothetical protein
VTGRLFAAHVPYLGLGDQQDKQREDHDEQPAPKARREPVSSQSRHGARGEFHGEFSPAAGDEAGIAAGWSSGAPGSACRPAQPRRHGITGAGGRARIDLTQGRACATGQARPGATRGAGGPWPPATGALTGHTQTAAGTGAA